MWGIVSRLLKPRAKMLYWHISPSVRAASHSSRAGTTTNGADQQQQRITPGTHKYKLVLAIPAILCSQGRLRVGGDALRGKIGGVGGVATATGCVALLLPRWLSAQIAPEHWCARPNQKSWMDTGRSAWDKESLQVLPSPLRTSGPIGSEAHPQVPVKRAHEGVK